MATVIRNAEDLFSQVTSLADIMDVMQELISNEDLYGLENLEPFSYTIDTADGTSTKYVHANGYINVFGSALQQNADNTFANSISSGAGSPSDSGGGDSGGGGGGGEGSDGDTSGSGKNMFGDMGKKLQDMMKRVSPQAEKKQKEVIKDVNTSDDAKKIQKIVQALIKGKNPIDPSLLKD
jgi:hypothetical protein